MSGRSRGRTLSNGSNSSANSSTTSRRRSNNDNNSNNNINNDIETSRKSKNRRNGKKNMDFVIERGSKPLVAGNSEECSPSTGCRTPLASILYSTKRNDHDISDTVVRDIRKKQCTAVPALPDVLITNTSIQNPIFFGETFRNLREDMNDNSAHPLRSALGLGSATVLGVGKGTYEDGGVDMKCQSPRTDELDIDYLSFSSKSSSTSPFHHPSSSFDSVRGNVREDNDGVMRGDKTVDANDNDDSESEYYSDSNSSSGNAAGTFYRLLFFFSFSFLFFTPYLFLFSFPYFFLSLLFLFSSVLFFIFLFIFLLFLYYFSSVLLIFFVILIG